MFRWAVVVGLLIGLLALHPAGAVSDGRAGAEGCPLRFDQLTTGLSQACMFVGRYNDTCGQKAVAIFAGDGVAMVVALAVGPDHPKLYLPAEVLSSTEGKLVRWRPDLELKTAASAGSVVLAPDGRSLRVAVPAQVQQATAQAGGCAFAEYVGEFVGMASADGRLD